MAHSDRGHPSVSSSGPAVPIAIKKKRLEGCLRRAFPEAPPPLKRMKKNQIEEEGDDTNSNVSAGPPDPRPRDNRVGPPTLFHRKLRQKIPWIHFSSRDFVCRTKCHSTSERGSRGEDETAVPCPTDLRSQPPNRTSFSTSFKIHSGVYRIYPKSTQRTYGSDEQRPTSGIRKGEFDQTTFLCARSSSPIHIRGYLFFSSHPPPRGALELELRRCRHTGGLQRSMDTITSHIPDPPAGNIRRSHWRYQRGEHGG